MPTRRLAARIRVERYRYLRVHRVPPSRASGLSAGCTPPSSAAAAAASPHESSCSRRASSREEEADERIEPGARGHTPDEEKSGTAPATFVSSRPQHRREGIRNLCSGSRTDGSRLRNILHRCAGATHDCNSTACRHACDLQERSLGKSCVGTVLPAAVGFLVASVPHGQTKQSGAIARDAVKACERTDAG
jgi:hypothetical protein